MKFRIIKDGNSHFRTQREFGDGNKTHWVDTEWSCVEDDIEALENRVLQYLVEFEYLGRQETIVEVIREFSSV